MKTRTVQLGDLVTIVGGGTPSRKRPEFYSGPIPWMSVKDFGDEFVLRRTQERITQQGLDDSASRLIPAGSVILGTRMSVGKAVINLVDIAINQDLKALFAKPDLDPSYLTYFFAFVGPRLESQASGATVKGITIDQIEDLQIPLPDLAEQKRIAGILEQADRLRRTRRYALELSDTLLPAAFLEMFGDLRQNPFGLPISPLGEICDVRDGTHDSPKFHREGYPLVTSKNLAKGYVDLTDVDMISKEDFVEINKRSKVDRGDMLMPMIGTIGNPVLVEQAPNFAIKNVALIKFTNASPSPHYIREILSGEYFRHLTEKNSRGGTQKFVALGDIRAFSIPVPPRELQQKFAALVERHERLRAAQRESLRQAEHLFQTLLHRAFTEGL